MASMHPSLFGSFIFNMSIFTSKRVFKEFWLFELNIVALTKA